MNHLESKAAMGFTYFVDVVARDGTVSQGEVVHNLIPQEGVDHTLAVTFKGAAQVLAWFIAPYEGNYTPIPTLKAADFPATATECTAYSSAQRVAFVAGAVANGSVDNAANRAEFLFTAPKTVYGAVLTSSAAKGSVNGVLSSAVRFNSPKVLDEGSTLRVVAANFLVSI